jgi:hypothetical protein
MLLFEYVQMACVGHLLVLLCFCVISCDVLHCLIDIVYVYLCVSLEVHCIYFVNYTACWGKSVWICTNRPDRFGRPVRPVLTGSLLLKGVNFRFCLFKPHLGNFHLHTPVAAIILGLDKINHLKLVSSFRRLAATCKSPSKLGGSRQLK